MRSKQIPFKAKCAWNMNIVHGIWNMNISIQRRTQDFDSGEGGRSNKISSKVARISVQSGDIQQKFTQQRLLKIFKNLY